MADRSEIRSIINDAAQRYGVDPGLMWTFSRIESTHDPNAVTGSRHGDLSRGYHGLFQLGREEWKTWGRGGDIYDPEANANAAARKLSAESSDFERKYGKPPSAHDLYMVHQQGAAGYAAHMANPEAPAWQNMASTGEGRQKGSGWARAAIWGNVPDVQKRQFGSVDNISSQDFMDLWRQKVAGFSGRGTADAAEGRRGAQTSFASYGDLAEMPEGYVPPVMEGTPAPSRRRGRIEGYAAYGEPAAMPEGSGAQPRATVTAPPSFASYGTIAEQPKQATQQPSQSGPGPQRIIATDRPEKTRDDEFPVSNDFDWSQHIDPANLPRMKEGATRGWRASKNVDDRRNDPPTGFWDGLGNEALRTAGNIKDRLTRPEMPKSFPSGSLEAQAGYNDIGRPDNLSSSSDLGLMATMSMRKEPVLLPPADLITDPNRPATLPWLSGGY